MKTKTIIQILSLIVGCIGLFMLFPMLYSVFTNENATFSFFVSFLFLSGIGFSLYFILKSKQNDNDKILSIREGFFIVTFAWIVTILSGTLPYLISGAIPDFTDAVFESASGFTTTGSSILSDIEKLPKSILLWRSLTHWKE